MAADNGQRHAVQGQAPVPMQGGNMPIQESHNALAENAPLNAEAEPQSSLTFHTCSGLELLDEDEIISELRTDTQLWPLWSWTLYQQLQAQCKVPFFSVLF
jgi:hypothetical protein